MKIKLFTRLNMLSLTLLSSHLFASDIDVMKTEIQNQTKPVCRAERLPEKIIVGSFDGGGMRGIITTTIMSEVEKRMGGHKIQEVCDVFAGTSTGGLIATALCSATLEKYKGQNMINVAQSLYKDQGCNIFKSNWFTSIFTSFVEDKYGSTNIEAALMGILGEYTLADLEPTKKTLIITSVDVNCPPPVECAPFIMNSKNKALGKIKLWEACRATSAAPTYFKPYRLPSQDGHARLLIDGGIICNHPGRVAIQEICKNYANFDPLDVQRSIKLVSFGTGAFYDQGKLLENGFDGPLEWASRITPASMCSTAQLVDSELISTFGTNRYMRLTPLLLRDYDMDDTSPKTIASYEYIGQKFAMDNSKLISNAAAMLLGQKIQD